MDNKEQSITVQGVEVHVTNKNDEDYISLTDMVSNFEGGRTLIDSWLRNKNTIEFLGVWERINNPNFNLLEFEEVKSKAGLNSFTMSPKKWIDTTNGIGLISKSGKYGGGSSADDIWYDEDHLYGEEALAKMHYGEYVAEQKRRLTKRTPDVWQSGS